MTTKVVYYSLARQALKEALLLAGVSKGDVALSVLEGGGGVSLITRKLLGENQRVKSTSERALRR